MNNQNRRHLLTSRSITDQAAELKCLKNSRRTSSRPRVNVGHDGCARSINRPKRIVSPWRPEFAAEQLALIVRRSMRLVPALLISSHLFIRKLQERVLENVKFPAITILPTEKVLV
jgi:hypothetical protein